MHTPILFLIFNRPETTRSVFAAIRLARPTRLYVAADGPRHENANDAENCARAREIATDVDWPCEVTTLFREQNLGCGVAVAEAITWFFDHEPEGIILEDDCVPNPSFFLFTSELLERYRHDERVAVIGGNCFLKTPPRQNESYFFSRFNHVWGWASWRRAWNLFDFSMKDWPKIRDNNLLSGYLTSKSATNYWRRHFQLTYEHRIDTWDYRWTFSCWREGMVSVLPRVNLVKNIGFGNDGTHTTVSPISEYRESELTFPLNHPTIRMVDSNADRLVHNRLFSFRARAVKRFLHLFHSGKQI